MKAKLADVEVLRTLNEQPKAAYGEQYEAAEACKKVRATALQHFENQNLMDKTIIRQKQEQILNLIAAF